jgi:hypothetical protein
MSFDFDATGIDPDSKGTNRTLPKRWYDFEIVEFVSKAGDVYPKDGRTQNGDPMVNILCEVINDDEFNGQRVFHTVTFLPAKKPDGTPTPGAGMSVHFLKTIGQPYEGKIKPDSSQWVGAEFKGYVIEDEYKGKKKNKISEIKPMDEFKNADVSKAAKDDSVPF